MSGAPTNFESSVLDELSWRGLIKQMTHAEIDEALDQIEPVTLYCGFDPSADSLHVGHLIPVMGLAHFRRHGHRPMALVGGATGMIGDPTGKSEERNLLDAEAITRNVDGLRTQLRGLLDRALTMHAEALPEAPSSGATPIPIVNNADWIAPWSFIDFLRDVGKHFRVNVMLSKDSVKDRLEQPERGLSYTEFSYMLIQGYDFQHLYDQFDCTLQIGGSDQWGNITAGTDLIGRTHDQSRAFGMTMPLLTTPDGRKFGKSEGNAVWLDPARTSPYEFYQYWVNQPDEMIPVLLRYFTFLPKSRVDALAAQLGANQGDLQHILAHEVTALVHGTQAAQEAAQAAKTLFTKAIPELSADEIDRVFSDVPSSTIEASRLAEGVGLLDLLVEVGLQSSKGAARRIVKQGGAYLNDARIEDIGYTLTPEDTTKADILVLRCGKKKQHVVRVDPS